MADDLPMEAMDDDMPELIDIDLPKQLPSLIEQNTLTPKATSDEFKQISSRKRKARGVRNVEMADESTTSVEDGVLAAIVDTEMADEDDGQRRSKRTKGEKGEMRKVPVPKHRYGQLKDNWVNIFTPIVKNLGLQIRFNMKTRVVEIRNPEDKEDTTDLQKAADFVKAFILGFDVNDALALIRLDHMFLESFEILDVKLSLKGDSMSRCIGRIAGKDGRTKLVIENVTKTRIVLADTKVHMLGAFQNLRLARHAICSLILGSPPSKVYGNMRNIASRANDRL
jgi:RNA-binding protein PNO1